MNLAFANTFYLASDIERWGSGLRRIHEACRDAGVTVDFQSIKTGFLVTFQRSEKTQPESQPESLDSKVLQLLATKPASKAEISSHLGQKEVSGQLNKVIRNLLAAKRIEYTIPGKPNSRLQQYRISEL